MSKVFKKPYDVKLPKSSHAAEEFGGGKKGIILCQDCDSFYFKKSWHRDFKGPKTENVNLPVNFKLCPACQMIKNKQYEGRIIFKNVPEKYSDELKNFIVGFCERAADRDPMDRLIEIKKSGAEWIATTTENQLANKLAKKIKDVFNKLNLKTKFSQEPSDVVEITVEFPKSKI